MSFLVFLRSKIISLCFIAVCSMLFSIFYKIMFSSVDKLFVFYLFEAVILMIYYAVDYYFSSRKIKRLKEIAGNAEQKYLLGELLPEPSNAVECYYFEIMKQLSRAVIAETEKEKIEKKEYMDFVDSWIHELKTPLTAISLILDNDGPSSSVRRELKKADNLTETVLFYAGLREKGDSTNISEFSVAQALNETVRDQKILLISAGCSIEINGDFTVCTDRRSFEFIISQLLVNCSKYCKGCKIEISAHDSKVSVKDNGPGIPSYEIMKITSKGYTGRLRSDNSSSTGMGLFIVSELCRHLDIKLDISSEVNKYTEITLTFHNLTKL